MELHTEQLSKDCASMQWALPQYVDQDVSACRGNQSLSTQDSRPLWLQSKIQYLAFTSFRNFPRLQLRKIITAIRERSLDFGHPAVATLVQQTLYHVGPILPADQCHSRPYPEWRTDLHIDAKNDFSTDLASILHKELAGFAEEICESPRQHRTLFLLSTMAGYFSQSNESFREVTRQLAHATMQWAADIEKRIAAVHSAEEKRHLQTLKDLQCLYNMYAIAAHHHGKLNEAEGETLIQLACLVQQKLIFEDKTTHHDDLQAMKLVCTKVMLLRADQLLGQLADPQHRDNTLSKVLGAVLPRVEKMKWKMATEVI